MPKSSKDFDLLVWVKDNYLFVVILFLTLYLLFAFLAPVLMEIGHPEASKIIYRAYSNLCHQYAYRSWFLFGEQAHYPLVRSDGLLSLFDYFDVSQQHPEFSREIIGNERAGYKVAICQRDVALYAALLLSSIIFILTKKRIKRLPFSLWILLAVLPIGMDGLLQLASSSDIFSITYESTPLMRTITGTMFGLFSGWLLFPAIQQTITNEKRDQ